MAYRNDWVDLIRRLAPRYGVDPRAALAVASAEGLSGAVGDSGTSFGPFQLHVGGALPRGRGQGWAESPAGIDYALRQIGGVARGLQGRQAVEAIVRRFERPADPTGEVTRALGSYGSFGGNATSPGGGPSVPLSPAGVAPGPSIANLLRSQLASGKVDWFALARAAKAQQPVRTPAARTPMQQVAGALGHPVEGKLIGTPYSGTHTLGNWESDNAIDVATPVGTPVYAPFSGVVGSQYGSLGKGGRFAGLRLHIANPQNEWYGGHLSRLVVKPGQQVKAGQLIGYSGSANGVAHLHEALRRGNPRGLR